MGLMEPTDLDLLASWRDGDAKAGNALFDRYFDALFRFFRNKVQDGAEDLVQQTFLALVQSRDRFRGDASFRTYLFTAARSKLYNYLERRGRDGVIDYGVTSCEDLGISPSALVGRDEQHKHLLLALRQLPVDMQVALELYYFERIRGPELAEVLGIPEGTVRSRLRRGVEALRQRLLELQKAPELVESTMSNLDDWAAAIQGQRPGAANVDPRRTGVVLAAGFGSRLRGADDEPIKPLVVVAGVPMIFRALRQLVGAGCNELVVVIGYRGEDLRAAIAAGPDVGAPVKFVENPRFDLANGVSLLSARSELGPTFVVAMADHVVGDDVMALAQAHTPEEGGATLLVDARIAEVFDLDDATKVRCDGDRLVDIGKQITDYNCIDIGVFVCTHGLLDALEEERASRGDASLSQGVARLAARGKMAVLEIQGGFWQDVDTPEMLAHAQRLLSPSA